LCPKSALDMAASPPPATAAPTPPTPPPATCILFSKEYVQEIERSHRIPPTSIGVRRIRPSSKAILTELKRQKRAKKNTNSSNNNISNNGDDANEQKHEEGAGVDANIERNGNIIGSDNNTNNNADSNRNIDGATSSTCTITGTGTNACHSNCNDNLKVQVGSTIDIDNDRGYIIEIDDSNGNGDGTNKSTKRKLDQEKSDNDNDNNNVNNFSCSYNQQRKQKKQCYYHQLTIDPQIIQEEIAELKCVDRAVYNNLPAVMSPPMTHQARKHGLLQLQQRVQVLPSASASASASSNSNSTAANNNDGMIQRSTSEAATSTTSTTSTSTSTSTASVVINDELASRWSEALRKIIQVEEHKRNEEDLRPLVYKLMPEVWTRLRPSSVGNETSTDQIKIKEETGDDNDDGDDDDDVNINTNEKEQNSQGSSNNNRSSNNGSDPSATMNISKHNSIIVCKTNIRLYNQNHNHNHNSNVNLPTDNHKNWWWYNKSHEIVYDCLYNEFPNFHISCGAKFGCDYLIYDGCRMERHAFAGLRIVCATERHLDKILLRTSNSSGVCSRHDGEHEYRIGDGDGDGNGGIVNSNNDNENNGGSNDTDDGLFPLPTPYDLSAYVRVLNTAGKLALLALVVTSDCDTNKEFEELNGGGYSCSKLSPSSAAVPSVKNVNYNVAFVDLALEQVPEASTHIRKRKRKKQSKNAVGLHLDKK